MIKFQNILFDLDGTLTDPREGITRCIQHALEKLGKPAPATDDLLWCIGPPLRGSFQQLLAGERAEMVDQALLFYRERFSTVGKFENKVYPDIPAVLEQLSRQGARLFIATSKPAVFARDIAEHFNLLPYFRKVYGSELTGRLTLKVDLVKHVMEAEGLSPATTVMIGDRSYDMEGAKKSGIASIGVTYGFGSRQELEEAGASWIVHTPSGINDCIAKQAR